MAGGAALSAAFTVAGLAASWSLDLPAGAVVVAIAGAAFLAVSAAVAVKARKARGGRA